MKGIKAVRRTSKHGVYCTGGVGGSDYTELKVGETYKVKGAPELCFNGFHFFKEENVCFGVGYFDGLNKGETVFIEVETSDGFEVVCDTEKCCCTSINVTRYVPKKEWAALVDGYRNSGNRNSGNRNSGDYNSGSNTSYFCSKKKLYLFDVEVEQIPDFILNLDMSWFSLDGKTYKEAWEDCPATVLDLFKNWEGFDTDARSKFKEITGIDI